MRGIVRKVPVRTSGNATLFGHLRISHNAYSKYLLVTECCNVLLGLYSAPLKGTNMGIKSEMALNRICEKIEEKYNNIFDGGGIGYRFMMSPRQTFSKDTNIALITLNPGGSAKPVGHPECYTVGKSAYLSEKWNFKGKPYEPGEQPLQKQIRELFRLINEKTGLSKSGDTLLDTSFCAQYIPFRSKSYKKLEHKKQCKEFSKTIWQEIFSEHLAPRLIICIDKIAFSELKSMFDEAMGTVVPIRMGTGWGNIKVDIVTYYNGMTMVRFPHLSRFRIFGRKKSEGHVESIMTKITSQI